MPRLAAYLSDTNSNFLIETDENSYELATFPYSYETRLFSNQVNIGDFYKQVFETISRSYKKKLSDFDIYIASNQKDLNFPFDVKGNVSINQVLDSFRDYQVLLLGPRRVYAKGLVNGAVKTAKTDQEESKFFDNSLLYSQIIPNDVAAQTFVDSSIIGSFNYFFNEGTPVVLSGDRFNNLYSDDELSYVVGLESIRNNGIYDVYVSPQNAIVLIQTLKMFVKGITISPLDYSVRLGSLIKSSGGAECLIKSDLDTQQFFEVKKNSIFTLPLLENDKSIIQVKLHDNETIERNVDGGKIGLIVDTRDSDNSV